MSEYTQEDFKHMALAGGYEMKMLSRTGDLKDPQISKTIKLKKSYGDLLHWWHPDTDLADNYRLAIDAGIDIKINLNGVVVKHCKEHESYVRAKAFIEFYDAHNNDKHAATMKAVCDCAKAVGKTMGWKE